MGLFVEGLIICAVVGTILRYLTRHVLVTTLDAIDRFDDSKYRKEQGDRASGKRAQLILPLQTTSQHRHGERHRARLDRGTVHDSAEPLPPPWPSQHICTGHKPPGEGEIGRISCLLSLFYVCPHASLLGSLGIPPTRHRGMLSQLHVSSLSVDGSMLDEDNRGEKRLRVLSSLLFKPHLSSAFCLRWRSQARLES